MSVYKKGTAVKLSANFKSTEFDCNGENCCEQTLVDNELVSYLQKIRDHFGKAITINSGYRCSVHNKAVGGTKSSRHLHGEAADIVVSGVEPKEVAKYAESIGIKGIGLYDTFVHIDTRTTRSFWYGHNQEYRETFGGIYPIKSWQTSAMADGFKFPSGVNGIWGKECEAVAKSAICKKRIVYKYKHLTKFIQNRLGIEADGKFGNDTKNAVINYQKLMGLTADGVVGLNTWKKLLGVK